MMTVRCPVWTRRALLAFGTGAYAWLAYRGASQVGPSLTGAALGFTPLVALTVWLTWRSPLRLPVLILLALVASLSAGHTNLLLQHYRWAYLAQHAGAMMLFGVMFGRSLLPGQEPMVTRFARHAHTSLTPRVVRYTRGVTWVWTLFFAAMAVTSLTLFASAPRQVWALFAEGLTPLLVLAIFAAEYLVRVRALPADERVGPIQAVQAYVRYRAAQVRASRNAAP